MTVAEVDWDCLECGKSGVTTIKKASGGQPSMGKCPRCGSGDLMEEVLE